MIESATVESSSPVQPELEAIAEAIRAFVISTNRHIGGGTSSAELMSALYFSGATTAAELTGAPDRVVLSKGHAPGSFYFCLWLLGRYGSRSLDDLLRYGTVDSEIPRMPQRDVASGVEMSTGALGQGLSFGAGQALADRKLGVDRQTFVVLGDGECTEGQVWEAAGTAAKLSLRNLTAVVDVNGFGSGIALDRTQWNDKWRSFGFEVSEVDGHDVAQVADGLRKVRGEGPACLLLHTVKGRGLRDGLAGTDQVHNEVPEPDRQRPELPALVAEAQRAVVRLGLPRGRVTPAPDHDRHQEIDRVVAQLPATETIAQTAHTKKFMRDLVPVVPRGSRLVFVTPDARTNNALEAIEAAQGGLCDWGRPEASVVECDIAEQDAASVAAGLAAGGLKPVLMLMEGFVWRMLDSLRESILFPQLPVTVVATSGGLGDGLGPMVQSDSCFHAVTGMFGVETFEANDINVAKVLFGEALRCPSPTYLRLPHEVRPVLTGMAEAAGRDLQDGYWILRAPERPALTLVTAGGILPHVLTAADELASRGLATRVVEVFSVTRFRRLGRQQVGAVLGRDTPTLSVHNAPSSVLGAFLADRDRALGVDSYGFHGKPVDRLYGLAGISAPDIVDAAAALVDESPR